MSDVRRAWGLLERRGSSGSRTQRRAGVPSRPTFEKTQVAEALNENFGPVRNDDGDIHIGEGGNGLGPYGAGHTVEPGFPEALADGTSMQQFGAMWATNMAVGLRAIGDNLGLGGGLR